MDIIHGKGASGGMVRGRIHCTKSQYAQSVRPANTGNPSAEVEHFRECCRTLHKELESLYTKTRDTVGEAEAEIFSIHQMMLAEEAFTEPAENAMKEGISAVEAVRKTGENLAADFTAMDTPYMQARAADIRSITERLTELLQGKTTYNLTPGEPSILVLQDLTPAQIMELDPRKVLGFITEQGAVSSHTSILARTLGIPAVVSAGNIPEAVHGREGILDGKNGVLYVSPDAETQAYYEKTASEQLREKENRQAMRGHRCRTAEGTSIQICANAGSIEDVQSAEKQDAEGIGLFRSEFLFMQYERCPTEEEQYTVYKTLLETMENREVVIRTLDAGADKKIPWLPAGPIEANPALGFRAIRISLRYPELLETQLRALYRASAHGRISAMIPMITLPSELEKVLAIARCVRDSLTKENIPHNPSMPIGIMIETPSAALYAETLAGMASFFSIGTNDLTQYTMAADRENPAVAYLTETVPESVKMLIRMALQGAGKAGIPCGVCGELAGDPGMIPFFIREGVTKLSVSPVDILRVRAEVRAYLDSEKQNTQKTKEQ